MAFALKLKPTIQSIIISILAVVGRVF